MDRKELLRLMPRNAQDAAGASRLTSLGYSSIRPVHRDMIQAMRVADSPAAEVFADYFAGLGKVAIPEIADGLQRENCWLRHRFFVRVFPFWSDEDLLGLQEVFTMIATQPDPYDNDLRCICLLAERKLTDLDWLQEWLDFKCGRMKERDILIAKATALVREARPAK